MKKIRKFSQNLMVLLMLSFGIGGCRDGDVNPDSLLRTVWVLQGYTSDGASITMEHGVLTMIINGITAIGIYSVNGNTIEVSVFEPGKEASKIRDRALGFFTCHWCPRIFVYSISKKTLTLTSESGDMYVFNSMLN